MRIMIDYTNWRGERGKRRVEPTGELRFSSNQWHPDEQWLLMAVDVDGGGLVKGFALNNIHGSEPCA